MSTTHIPLGQPDQELAKAFWDVYLKRNQSIIVDLFHGQLKSTLTPQCGHIRVNFDPFTFLSLPMPIDVKRAVEIFFFWADGTKQPQRFSILIDRYG